MKTSTSLELILSIALLGTSATQADWSRFRGPNGSGIASDHMPTPTTWSDTQNLKWKFSIPGPGSSSPIVMGNKVFVTCWTGYGVDPDDPGNMDDLKRHLLCIDRQTGKEIWSRSVKAILPEDTFGGMFAQHGYASHTPVTDGERVYAFFGKSGVHAFDMQGNPLWNHLVGSDLDARRWGSASSPIIAGDALIVTATIENHALVGFNKKSGKKLWEQVAQGLGGTWSTPVLVNADSSPDLVLGVPDEIWALNPSNGKLRWYTDGIRGDSITGSVVTDGGIVYATGSRGGGSIAVKAGGKGKLTESQVLWEGRDGSRIATPLLHDGRLYWVNSSIVNCRDAKTGEEIYAERIPGSRSAAGQGEGRRRGGGRFGSTDYASPVAAGNHMYQVTRGGDILVVALGPKFQFVARNRFASDNSDYSATPAISKGQLFIRSSRNLYCVAETK